MKTFVIVTIQKQKIEKYKSRWAATWENIPSDMCSLISLLLAWRNFASLAIQNVPSEDSDQTADVQADLNLC